jgi:DNA-binding LacI/PurR family transcriptional regulator
VRPASNQRGRVTISDIAARAGVSKGAVSFALNDRPGLSVETRQRILGIARELGWYPNRAARALSAARAHAYGLVIARPAKTLAFEPFFMELVSGVEAELAARSVALALRLTESLDEEIDVYRRWWAERRVDGVFVVDLRVDDPRPAELARIGLPAVVVGGPLGRTELPAVWHDDASVLADVVRHLAELGHTRVARVAGVPDFVHTAARTAAFRRIGRALSLSARVVSTDFTPESGARATRRLLSDAEPPTAILYDSDLLAVTGLGVAQQLGYAVPGDLSIVAWGDSLLCHVVHPPLTAVTRDIPAYGVAAAERLCALVEEEETGDYETPRGELTVRQSTGAAPAASENARRPRPRKTRPARI